MGRTVTGYFDYIKDFIECENVFTMEEFSKSMNEFLAFCRYDMLKDNGCISHKQAVEKVKISHVLYHIVSVYFLEVYQATWHL
ncbi:MAG: RhuM family protein [Catenibacterium sp.]|uniref:RhuM family protein n=1 Tax=Catenibacterium sp. TaxID=2049022 RepID=UPI0039925160